MSFAPLLDWKKSNLIKLLNLSLVLDLWLWARLIAFYLKGCKTILRSYHIAMIVGTWEFQTIWYQSLQKHWIYANSTFLKYRELSFLLLPLYFIAVFYFCPLIKWKTSKKDLDYRKSFKLRHSNWKLTSLLCNWLLKLFLNVISLQRNWQTWSQTRRSIDL